MDYSQSINSNIYNWYTVVHYMILKVSYSLFYILLTNNEKYTYGVGILFYFILKFMNNQYNNCYNYNVQRIFTTPCKK